MHMYPFKFTMKKNLSYFFFSWCFELIQSSNSSQFLFFEKKNYFTFYKGVHFHILIQCRMITNFQNSVGKDK